jgi:transcriptional regulator with PAS, ATPase and Fis domain
MIQPAHLPDGLRPAPRSPFSSEPATGSTLDELKARYIRDALERNHFSRAATARELGVHKTTLWRQMKRLGIRAPNRTERRTATGG